MAFNFKSIAELADILGVLNLSQNLSQSKQLKILKIVVNNQLEIMEKLNKITDKEK
ncbi:MAG: hypothetical protein RSC96_04425 [Oscillospiraceae bacterium]